MNQIQKFSEINDYINIMNLNIETKNPDFFVYDYQSLHPDACSGFQTFRQSYFEITLERSKGCNFAVDQFKLPPDKNRLTLISPYRLQTYYGHQFAGQQSHGYSLFFKPEFISLNPGNSRLLTDFPFFSHLNTPSIALKEDEAAVFELLIRNMKIEYETNSRTSHEIIKNYLNILFLKAKESYSNDVVSSKGSGREREIFEEFSSLVQHHVLEWRTVGEYADQMYITPKHLSETVKKVSGQSALSLIHHAQINHAKALLRQTPKTVTEIAYDLNFENPEYFSVFFKRVSGESPSQYRDL